MKYKYRTMIVRCIDLIAVYAGVLFSSWILAYTTEPLMNIFQRVTHVMPYILVMYSIALMILKLYQTRLNDVSIDIGINIVLANLLASSSILGLRGYFPHFSQISINAIILSFFIITLIMELNHFHIRVLSTYKQKIKDRSYQEKILIYGAGNAGRLTLKELQLNDKYKYRVIGFIDDDHSLRGLTIHHIPILGDGTMLAEMVHKYTIDHVIIAIQSTPLAQRKNVINAVIDTGVPNVSIMSSISLDDPKHDSHSIRKIEIQDLLNRDSIHLDTKDIQESIQNASILVTGASGSIGSELVRQIVNYNPKRIVLYDINESGLYQIEQELLMHKRTGLIHQSIECIALVGSIRDKDKLSALFRNHQCTVVFHAAAYKHVPLMEATPTEAIQNNIFGSKCLIDVSIEHNVTTFVNISTDKAVNPTNVMGATKRFVEMMIHSEACMNSNTRFVAVRFGNVLGSNGSVIPLFQKQIEQGGPVTVTDPNVVRYFMTIPEAVSLVLQASTLAQGGEIFVLDMGEPVKIKDLAEKMIRLSGYEPDKEIQIHYVGLRPGEKLYEELLMDEEGLRHTSNELIFVAKPKIWDDTLINEYLEILTNATKLYDTRTVKEALQSVVNTYVFEEHTHQKDGLVKSS